MGGIGGGGGGGGSREIHHVKVSQRIPGTKRGTIVRDLRRNVEAA